MHNKTEFIRLHKAETNTSMVINVADIEYITVGDGNDKYSMVVLRDPRVEPFPVNETPDKIYRMLNVHELPKT
jgi:hypothetical protein